MPSLPPVTGVLKVSMNTPVTAHPTTASRFFMDYTGTPPTGAQLTTLAGQIGTDWGTHLASFFSTNTSLAVVTIEDLSNLGASGFQFPAVAGTRVGTEVPIQCAAVINFAILRRYRGGKPKVFLNAGVDSDLADVRSWNGSFVNNLVAAWDAFITAVLAHTWSGGTLNTQVNVSYYTGFTTISRPPFRPLNRPNLRPSPLVDAIDNTLGEVRVGSQRRRRG